ncbi:peptidylprolyl isomerase [soil metagenome]
MSKTFSVRVLVVVVVVALLAFAGCSPADPAEEVESGAQKVVTFDGGKVTKDQVKEAVDQFAQQSGAGEVPPDSPQYDAALQQVVPQLVGVEVAKAYAKENDISVSQQDVDKEIETIKDQISEQAKAAGQNLKRDKAFEEALKQADLTEDQLRQDIRDQLPLQKVQEEVVGDVKPSDANIKAFYDENKDLQFSTPAQRCISHILFNKDQKKKAEDVKEQLKGDGDFEKLAKEFSQDPGSKDKGGELGCQGKGSFVPEFEKAAFNADEGEVVGPVETEFGYHVIKVTETKAAETAPLEEVKPQIREQLAQEKQFTEFEKWLDKEKKKRNIKYMKGYDPEKVAPAGTTDAQPGGATAEQ